MKIRTPYNYQPLDSEKETTTGESQTIPGEAYTIRELLEKFTKGIMPPIGRKTQYDEDPDIDQIDPTRSPDFDLSDTSIMAEELNTIMEKQNKLREAEEKAKNKKEALKEAQALIKLESEAKEQEKHEPPKADIKQAPM